MSDSLGIDLGTITTVAAICNCINENATFSTIGDAHGSHTTPSMVYMTFNTPEDSSSKSPVQSCLVGANAREEILKNPKNVFTYTNAMIGRSFHNPIIQALIPELQYEIEPVNEMPFVYVEEGGNKYYYEPEKLAALILSTAYKHARQTVKDDFKKIVLTVPATAGSLQRQSYKRAALMAGFRDVSLIPEPIAIAIHYYYLQKKYSELSSKKGSKAFLIIDIGGFSTKVSLVHFEDHRFKLLSCDESNEMSGRSITKSIFKLAEEEIKKKGLDLEDPRFRKQRNEVWAECEMAKCSLPSGDKRNINFTDKDGKTGVVKISQDDIESGITDIFQDIDELVENVMKMAAGVKYDQILIAGTTARIETVVNNIKDFFTDDDIYVFEDTTAACALGASIYSSHLSSNYVVPELNNIYINERLPMNLNVAIARGKVQKIISRGTQFTAESEEQYYRTVRDEQESFDIKIYEGNYSLRRECVLVADGTITGIPKGPKGSVSIGVQVVAENPEKTPIVNVNISKRSTRMQNKLQRREDVTEDDKKWVQTMLTQ